MDRAAALGVRIDPHMFFPLDGESEHSEHPSTPVREKPKPDSGGNHLLFE